MTCSVKGVLTQNLRKVESVNGVVIRHDEISREAQHHPAPTPIAAWTTAARALAVRELLLQEARRTDIDADPCGGAGPASGHIQPSPRCRPDRRSAKHDHVVQPGRDLLARVLQFDQNSAGNSQTITSDTASSLPTKTQCVPDGNIANSPADSWSSNSNPSKRYVSCPRRTYHSPSLEAAGNSAPGGYS
jgi:hypothetical protein